MKHKDSQTERGRREGRKSASERDRLERENRDLIDLIETRHPGTMRVLLRKLRRRWRDQ